MQKIVVAECDIRPHFPDDSPPVLSSEISPAALRDRLLVGNRSPAFRDATGWAQRARVARFSSRPGARLLEVARTATVHALCVRTLRLVRWHWVSGSSLQGMGRFFNDPWSYDAGNVQPARVDKARWRFPLPAVTAKAHLRLAPNEHRSSAPAEAIRPRRLRHLQPRSWSQGEAR